MPRRDFSKVAFAATGDTNVIPTPAQPDGSISLQTGWGFDYQRDNGAGGGTPDPLAKNIDREDINGILNEITASVGEIQQNGFAIWVNTAAPYPANSQVRHVDKVWQSQIANNNSEPGTNSDWKEASAPVDGRLINVRTFSVSGTYTPTAGTKFVIIDLVGAGGGGGASTAQNATNVAAATGGGGGGFVRTRLTTGFSGASFTVGSGGAGGIIGVSGGNGLPGGASTFGAASAAGGVGGLTSGGLAPPYVLSSGGQPASSGGNILNAAGSASGDGFAMSTVSAISGRGGISFYGAGAPSVVGTNTNGNPATVPGTGGSGSLTMPNGATRSGGVGAGGLMTVYEFGGL